MLRNAKTLEGFDILATDGPIGPVKDFYFDDDAWVVRYLVVETGSWLDSRKVLISPIAVHDPNLGNRTLSVSVSKQQVKGSPSFDSDKPVTRDGEARYAGYYGYLPYWAGSGLWGAGLYPFALFPGDAGAAPGREQAVGAARTGAGLEEEAQLQAERERHRNPDPHLRSCSAVKGYKLRATDGQIGTVASYLVDDQTWAIAYLVVETGHWWNGHQVLLAPQWIFGVDWSDEAISVELSLADVKGAPAYEPDMPWSRMLDTSLYQHYGRTGYWSGAPGRAIER